MIKKVIPLILIGIILAYVSQLTAYVVDKTKILPANHFDFLNNIPRKRVTNNCANPILVPNNTQEEWEYFLNGTPACVSVSAQNLTLKNYTVQGFFCSYGCSGSVPSPCLPNMSCANSTFLVLPPGYRNPKLISVYCDDVCTVYLNGNLVYSSPGWDMCHLDIGDPYLDISSMVHAGNNTFSADIGNVIPCNNSMSAGARVDYQMLEWE